MSGLDLLAQGLATVVDTVRPLVGALEQDNGDQLGALLAELGFPLDDLSAQLLHETLSSLAQAGGALEALDETLREQLTGGSNPTVVTAVATAGASISALGSTLRTLETSLTSHLAATSPGQQLPEALRALCSDGAEQVVDRLLIREIEQCWPRLLGVLQLLGIITRTSVREIPFIDDWDPHQAPDSNPPVRAVAVPVDTLHWDRLAAYATAPGTTLAGVYGWGAPGGLPHGGADLLVALGEAGSHLGLSPKLVADVEASALTTPSGPQLELSLLRAAVDEIGAMLSLTLVLQPVADGGTVGVKATFLPHGMVQETVALSERVTVTIQGTGDVPLVLTPTGAHVPASTGSVGLQVRADLTNPSPTPMIVLGTAGSTRLELSGAHLAAHASYDTGHQALSGGADAGVDAAALVLDLADADGFLRHIFGGSPIRAEFALTGSWDPATGFHLHGNARLEVTVPVHRSIGGLVDLHSLYLSLGAAKGAVALTAAVTGSLALGPLRATVDRVGASLVLAPRTGSAPPGNLGTAQLDVRFVPPRMVGLTLKAEGVDGAGFLLIEPDHGQYAGGMDITVGPVSGHVVGLLATRMPDGSPIPGTGWSLLLAITATFPPIQVGFGFALTGLGGLITVNRSIAVAELRNQLSRGSLDSFLFPKGVANRPETLVPLLDRYFPTRPGQYVVGPAIQLTWGTPRIITISLGLLLEFPSPTRIVLAGRLRVALPRDDKPLILLQSDLLGVLDLSGQQLSVDATLRDSHVAVFTLSGDVALRMSWGRTPAFVLAAGGFNPRFRPPAGIRPLQRLAIALVSSRHITARAEAYLAVTSNSIQIGGRLEFHASAEIVGQTFSVDATAGFDALITWPPFAFVFDIYLRLELRWNGHPFLGVDLYGSLSGTHPWRLRGHAGFHFFCLSYTFPIDTGPIGPGSDEQLPARVEVVPLLAAAVADPHNWRTLRPADGDTVAAVADTPPVHGQVRVHPRGRLQLVQRVVPLARRIDRVGGAPPADAADDGSYKITGTDGRRLATVQDLFARAQFTQVSEEERLTAPSFEPMAAGVDLSTDLDNPTDPALPPSPHLPANLAASLRSCTVTQVHHTLDLVDRKPGSTPQTLRTSPDPTHVARLVRAGPPLPTRSARARTDRGPALGVHVQTVRYTTANLATMTRTAGDDRTYTRARERATRREVMQPPATAWTAVVAAHELVGS